MDCVRKGQHLIADSLGFQHPHAIQFFDHGVSSYATTSASGSWYGTLRLPDGSGDKLGRAQGAREQQRPNEYPAGTESHDTPSLLATRALRKTADTMSAAGHPQQSAPVLGEPDARQRHYCGTLAGQTH